MYASEIKKQILSGALDNTFSELYSEGKIICARERYARAIDEFIKLYGECEASVFSVSGRSELSGNHTDHNRGKVIAASIDLDIIAVASPTDDGVVQLKSEGFSLCRVDLNEFTSPLNECFGSSGALIAGMAAFFKEEGFKVGGFNAYTTSSVLKGSGLSSSAAFEDMVGTIFSHLYNGGIVDNVLIAKLAQKSENVFFGKPCGLMDQVACAAGGIVAIDFKDPASPVIEKLDVDMTAEGYNLCIVNTGGNHADLTDDYAAVPFEMKSVAALFGKEVLRDVSREELISAIPVLREKVGDRAILRALHFLGENERVESQVASLKKRDILSFLSVVLESGRSSFCYLQNVYTNKNVSEQGLSLALCLADGYLSGKNAAHRVHGGGFAGTIQAFMPSNEAEGFRALMDSVFGDGACIVLRIRQNGAMKLI